MARNTQKGRLLKLIIILLFFICLFSVGLIVGYASSKKTSQLKTKAEDITDQNSVIETPDTLTSTPRKIKVRIAYENESNVVHKYNIFEVTQIKYRVNNNMPYKNFNAGKILIESELGRGYAKEDISIPIEEGQRTGDISVWVIGMTGTRVKDSITRFGEQKTCSSFQTINSSADLVDLGELIFRYNGEECNRKAGSSFGLVPKFIPTDLYKPNFDAQKITQTMESNANIQLDVWYFERERSSPYKLKSSLKSFYYENNNKDQNRYTYREINSPPKDIDLLPSWIQDLENYNLEPKGDMIILDIKERLSSALTPFKSVILPLTLGFKIREYTFPLPEFKSARPLDTYPQRYEISKEEFTSFLQNIIDSIGDQFTTDPNFLIPIRSS